MAENKYLPSASQGHPAYSRAPGGVPHRLDFLFCQKFFSERNNLFVLIIDVITLTKYICSELNLFLLQ